MVKIIELIIDNRVLILRLDDLYRESMKEFECGKLLTAARELSALLNVEKANVPTIKPIIQ